jgi:hypothetical protein
VYLLNFCQEIRQQSFYKATAGALIPNCFIESFRNYFMGRDCLDRIEKVNLWPCCQDTRFPYPPNIFDNCIVEGIDSLYQTQSNFYYPTLAGPKFVRGTKPPRIGVVIIEYFSAYNFTFNFDEMSHFYNEVGNWFNQKLVEAPVEMKNGWFVSELGFFDLQHSLVLDTLVSTGIAMIVCFVIVLLTTLELPLSIYAVFTVTLIKFCTIAVLTLLGWSLNVLESAIITVSIGLAVDFTLHYGVAYKLSAEPFRVDKVRDALKSVGAPVTMGATATFLAGVSMLFSHVLAHIQIGIFLLTLTAISWAFSTFFFCSVLAVIGTEKSCFDKCRGRNVRNESPIPAEPIDPDMLESSDPFVIPEREFDHESHIPVIPLRPAIRYRSQDLLGLTTSV